MVLLAVAAALGASAVFVRELWTDKVTTFATLGGFVTLYGVAFAVVETSRTRSAADLAHRAASRASARVLALAEVRGAVQGQAEIRTALSDLDNERWTSTSALSRIVEAYTAQFHEAYAQPESAQRLHIAALQSHASSASGPLSRRAVVRLKGTLLAMLSDLTASVSGTISETHDDP